MRRRLLVSYLAITVLVLVVFGIPLDLLATARDEDHWRADTRLDALVIGASYLEALREGLPLEDDVAREYVQSSGSSVVIADRFGDVQLDTRSREEQQRSRLPELEEALASNDEAVRHSSRTNVQYVAVPIVSAGTVYGAVRLGVDHEPVDRLARRFRLQLIAIAAGVLAVATIVGWAIARSISRPVAQLTDTASRFAAGDLGAGVAVDGGPPEIRTLAAAMGTMAKHLQELIDSQRRFVADASHQLHTPLTALRLRVENAVDAPPDERRAELEAAIDETERLTALVSSLLELARADEHRPPSSARELTDLGEVVRDRVDTWSAVAETLDVAVRADVPAGVAGVHAAPGTVEQILDNLLDNATQASPPGSTVTARVISIASGHRLTVLDEGPGLSEEHKVLALQRFWRGDTSRPGTGLGLSIVDSLARESDATVVLDDAPSGGLAVSVTFPRTSSPPRREATPDATRAGLRT